MQIRRYNLILFIPLLFITSQVVSQSTHAAWLAIKDSVISQYQARESDLEKRILEDITDSEYSDYKEQYAKEQSQIPTELAQTDRLVLGWDTWQNEIDDIVKEFCEHQRIEREFDVLITDNVSAVASAAEGGVFYVSLGLLADVESLAELRLVLAHAIGHFYYRDRYTKYVHYQYQQEMAETAVIAGMFLGPAVGVIAMGSTTGSRDEEYIAKEYQIDSIAARMLTDLGYSVEEGLGIYRYFEADRQKRRYVKGLHPRRYSHGFFHQNPYPRSTFLHEQYGSNEVPELKNPEWFFPARDEARIQKLDIMIRTGAYRESVEIGWHYLIKDNENDQVKARIVQALDSLKRVEIVGYYDSKVLRYDYEIDTFYVWDVRSEDIMLSDDYDFYETMILKSEQGDKSPYDLRSTFADLERELLFELGRRDSIECRMADGLLEGLIDDDDSLVQEYIKNEGRYSSYIEYLIGSGMLGLSRTICIPVKLYEKQYGYLARSYDHAFYESDWSKFIQLLEEDNRNVELQSFEEVEQEDSLLASFLYPLASLHGFETGRHESRVDLLNLDPEFARYIVENRVQKLIIIYYDEGSTRTRVVCQEIEVESGRVKHIQKILKSNHSRAPKYIPSRIAKVYEKLAKD